MKVGFAFGSLLISVAAAIAVAAGCSKKDDQSGTPVVDASVPAPPEVIARGLYLATTVGGCAECHTPRDAQGNLDKTKWLAGVADRFDLVPEDDTLGSVSAPNLTPAGLSAWTDDQIKTAILDGRDTEGAALYPLMPYYVFHNMSDDDANAIVAYLRTVPSVTNAIPDRQPLPEALAAPATPVPDSAIPHTTLATTDKSYARAEHGRYLAAQVGFCMDCHSPWRAGASQPLDLQNLFAGGRTFSAHDWVVPAPAPAVVYSYNITPDPSGIGTWTPDMVVTALKKGTDNQGEILCRPMPSGVMGGLGGLTDDDALDIGIYITTIAPIASGEIPECAMPSPDQDAATDGPVEGSAGDAGADASEAGGSDAGDGASGQGGEDASDASADASGE